MTLVMGATRWRSSESAVDSGVVEVDDDSEDDGDGDGRFDLVVRGAAASGPRRRGAPLGGVGEVSNGGLGGLG